MECERVNDSDKEDVDVKIEFERADESGRNFFMSDSTDQMEREYNTGNESRDLRWSGDSGGSLHLAMSADALSDKSSDDEQSSSPLHVSAVRKGCTCRRVGGNPQINAAGWAIRTSTGAALHAVTHACQSSVRLQIAAKRGIRTGTSERPSEDYVNDPARNENAAEFRSLQLARRRERARVQPERDRWHSTSGHAHR